MRLTTKSQYGLKVLSVLVRNYKGGRNDFVQVAVLARECKTSLKYLEQVLAPLARAGLLESRRGQHGGYRLNSAPEKVTLAEVLRHLEGLLMPIPQWADDADDGLPVGVVLRRVRESIRSILEETSIDVLAEDAGAPARADAVVKELMYYI
ncbi:MAG: Rrf2 family transcriptional regulator [Capsulimonadaceae bacterium]|nr:Rrf2 family transcriptional regulator [Capsulimonadaceae bacterium]